MAAEASDAGDGSTRGRYAKTFDLPLVRKLGQNGSRLGPCKSIFSAEWLVEEFATAIANMLDAKNTSARA